MAFTHHRTIMNYIYAGLFIIALTVPAPCIAQEHSPMTTGFLGLNTVPSARMDKAGTLRSGLSITDPYLHGYIGIQIADPLYINIRQTAETSNIKKDADGLYPGVDLKLRLVREDAQTPEISVGLQSAFGHKRMAGEFISLSKRYNNFDFTAGLGWGRYSTAGHFKNPMRAISSHFDTDRDFSSEIPNEPRHWFTGDKIGFFGGIEYFTPYEGLSIKADYGADHYSAEKSEFNFEPAAPWSVGLSYSPTTWLNAGLAIMGTEKIMGRFSIQGTPQKWPFAHKQYTAPKPFPKYRSTVDRSKDIATSAANYDLNISNIRSTRHSIYADVELPQRGAAPQEIGRALRHIAEKSAPNIEKIIITPRKNGLKGTAIKVTRQDFEDSVRSGHGSPQEIWLNTEFGQNKDAPPLHPSPLQLEYKSTNTYSFHLENEFSLAEEDHGFLYRSSIVARASTQLLSGLQTGGAFRLNIKDNLEKLARYRAPSSLPVRSDIDSFTEKRISLENAYIGYNASIRPDLHTSLSAGYLEEQYAGAGGEILYRPFKSRLALGAEIWRATHRLGGSTLNAGLWEGSVTTGHINAWYDVPKQDITLKARVGRFLKGDEGFTLGLVKSFDNGAVLSANVSASNEADFDIFGGTTHAHHSINLTLPLGSVRFIPNGSTIKTSFSPFGRDTAQSISAPTNLYDMTENMTIDHLARHWQDILH